LSTKYTSDREGVAKLVAAVPGFSLRGPMPILGRTLVVHNSLGERVACGVIEPANGMSVALTPYPGYRGDPIEGVMVVTQASAGIPGVTMSGTLAGLPSSSTGGYHIHTGSTCYDAEGVFGHYFIGSNDPWTTVRYSTDSRGVANVAGDLVNGYSLDKDMPVAGRAVVIHNPSGSRVACGLIGGRPLLARGMATTTESGMLTVGKGVTMIDVLEALVVDVGADWIDVLIVWMRSAGPVWVSLFTALIVTTAVVLFVPVFLLAMGLGYAWTYAYGGLQGVGFGSIVLLLASWLGASMSYALGSKSTWATGRFSSSNPTSFVGASFDKMNGHPVRLLLLLRSSPFVPFSPFNFYCGATDRFTFGQFCATFPAFMPLAFMWTGIGGAILKYRLVDRGLADGGEYLGFIWTGFSLSIVFMIAMAAVVYFSYNRVAKSGMTRSGAKTSAITLTTTGGPTRGVMSRTRYSKSKATDDDGGTVLMVDQEAPPPPPGPPPPPPPGDDILMAGWREVAHDDGEIYYFNDDTGESQWEKPLANGGEEVSPPSVEQAGALMQKPSDLGMAE